MTHLSYRCAAALALLLAGTPAATIAQVSAPPPALAPGYASVGQSEVGNPQPVDSWWRQYNDPVLTSLVVQALKENIDVKISAARIDASRAMLKSAKAQGRPEIMLGGSAGRERASAYAIGYDQATTESAFEASASASWEIDLFGRTEKGVVAARADVAAAREDMLGARLIVANEAARTYLGIRGLDQRIAILNEQARVQAGTATYTRHMFDAGSAPRADLDRAQALAQTTAADIPALALERDMQVSRLAVLLATTVQDINARLSSQTFPSIPTDVPTGIPADLLRARPDIAAAEARVIAAYGRLGIAEAELKPRFELGGMVGALVDAFTGVGLGKSFEWMAQAAGSAPLVDGGRRRSAIDLRKAESEEARLQYQSVVLGAVKEVEDALASLNRDRARSEALEQAAKSAASAADQVRTAWRAGQSPILDVLEADRSRLQAQDALVQAQTAVLRVHAQLYVALGG